MPEDRVGGDVTRILQKLRGGEQSAAEELFPLVYGELRQLASLLFAREKPGHTLQPTAIVHEAWLRLTGTSQPDYQDRTHFLAIAAKAMRQVLIDHARGRGRQKRGGDRRKLSLSDVVDPGSEPGFEVELLAIHHALEELSRLHERQAQLVELRYFGGLTVPEAADYLGVSPRTAEKDWTMAKAWLRRELGRSES